MGEFPVLEMKIEEVIANGAELLLHVYFVGLNCKSLLPHSLFVAKFFGRTHPMMIPEYGNELFLISSLYQSGT